MDYPRSLPDIFGDLAGQLATLTRTEARLARSEASEKIGRLGAGLGLVVFGAALLIPGVTLLLQAGVTALVRYYGVPENWSPLVVGGAAALLGLIVLMIGFGRFRASRLVPGRTIRQMQRDAAVARRQIGADDDATE